MWESSTSTGSKPRGEKVDRFTWPITMGLVEVDFDHHAVDGRQKARSAFQDRQRVSFGIHFQEAGAPDLGAIEDFVEPRDGDLHARDTATIR